MADRGEAAQVNLTFIRMSAGRHGAPVMRAEAPDGVKVAVDVSGLDLPPLERGDPVAVTGRFDRASPDDWLFGLGLRADAVAPGGAEVVLPKVDERDLRPAPDPLRGDSTAVVALSRDGAARAAEAVASGREIPYERAALAIEVEGSFMTGDASGRDLLVVSGRDVATGLPVRVEFVGGRAADGSGIEEMARAHGGRLDLEGTWKERPSGGSSRADEGEYSRFGIGAVAGTFSPRAVNGIPAQTLLGVEGDAPLPVAHRVRAGDAARAVSLYAQALVVPEFGLRQRLVDAGDGVVRVDADRVPTGRHLAGKSAVAMLDGYVRASTAGSVEVAFDQDRLAKIDRVRAMGRTRPALGRMSGGIAL